MKTKTAPKRAELKGTVSTAIGGNFERLEKLAEKHNVKPNTLARAMVLYAIGEMEAGRITLLPPTQAIPAA